MLRLRRGLHGKRQRLTSNGQPHRRLAVAFGTLRGVRHGVRAHGSETPGGGLDRR